MYVNPLCKLNTYFTWQVCFASKGVTRKLVHNWSKNMPCDIVNRFMRDMHYFKYKKQKEWLLYTEL